MGEFFSQDWIEEVRVKNDIVEVIGEYLRLKPSGRGFVALCPFHNEKTPSFSVSPDKQIYHCFGCGAGGNVINFIMEIEKVDFAEALRILASRANIPVPSNSRYADTAVKKREILYDINSQAARYFHNCLKSEEGREAVNYLKRRGIEAKTIIRFGIGFAPSRWDGLKQYMTTVKGYNERTLLDSGLIIESKDGNTLYDRFRNRIIFPIFDVLGRVIGFGGRVLDNSLPKYLNSPDTPLYRKGENLYGLNIVKNNRRIDNIIVVEGYVDAVMLHQYGISNVVASLGTSLTEQQARLLKRYTQKVIICYDGDSAGKSAAARGLTILLNEGLDVYVLVLPQGEDPDEFVRRHGKDEFYRLLQSSKPWIDYGIDQLKEKYDLSTPNGQAGFAREAVKLISSITDPIQRDIYLRRIENSSGASIKNLYMLLQKDRESAEPKSRHISIDDKKTEGPVIMAERALLNLAINTEQAVPLIMHEVCEEDFVDDLDRHIFEIIRQHYTEGEKISIADILTYFSQENDYRVVLSIFTNELKYDNINKFVMQCINTIKRNKIAEKRNFLCKKLDDLNLKGNKEVLDRLLEQIQLLDKELQGLRDVWKGE